MDRERDGEALGEDAPGAEQQERCGREELEKRGGKHHCQEGMQTRGDTARRRSAGVGKYKFSEIRMSRYEDRYIEIRTA